MVNLELIISRLLIKFPIFKVFIDSLEFIENNSVNTASTNGRKVYYNSNFLKEITLDEQVFIIAHELLHICLKHMDRMNGRNIEVWNYATDAVINQILKYYGFVLVPGVIDCSDASSYSSEEYYEKMINNLNCEDIMQQYRNENEKSDSVISSHNEWNNEKIEDILPDIDEQTLKKINDSLIEEENKKFLDKMSSNHEEKKIESIEDKKSILDWKSFLKKYSKKVISADYNFFKGEFDDEGIYYYPYELKKGCDVEILLDTSGSVNENFIRSFLNECKIILSDAKIKIACFDDIFHGFSEVKNKADIDNFEIKGRGGTDFDVAVSAFSQKSKLKIIFTDGYAPMPEKSVNAIWIVYSDEKINPPGGTVINIDPSEIPDYVNKKRL